MKKRHFLTYVYVFLLFVGLVILSDVLSIGERLAKFGPWAEYAFYALITAIVLWFIVRPIIQVVRTPEITGIPQEEVVKMSPRQLTEYIKRLNLSSAEQSQLRMSVNRSAGVREILDARAEGSDKIVKDTAQDILLLTAISQKGSLDVISSIALNFGMISKLIKLSGFRPSFPQLLRLYISVFSSSLIIYSVDQLLEEIDLGELFGTAGIGIGSVVFKSLSNGILNALVCLRVGYTTCKYLQYGGKEFNRNKAELQGKVRSESIKSLGPVLKGSYTKGKEAFKSAVL